MVKRPDFKRTDRYADRLQKLLMPGADRLATNLLSASTKTGTYTYGLPDDREVVMKIAIPKNYLDRDDADAVHEQTIESIKNEGNAMLAIKNGIKERARLFESGTGIHRPSIWIPEVYFNEDGILIREFMSGQLVSSARDLTLPAVERYGRDIMTISEGLGYAGWKAVEMSGDQPENPRGLEIRTRLLLHHSPHIGEVVLSPTGYDHLTNARDPEFRQLQHEDRKQAAWLNAMTQTAEKYQDGLTNSRSG